MEKENKLNLDLYKNSSSGATVDSSDSLVNVKYEYSWIGWFFITFFGTTQIPKKIEFKCIKTNEIFEVLTDKKLISHYIYYRRK